MKLHSRLRFPATCASERHFVGLSGEQSSPLAHARIIHNRAGSILIPGNRELVLFGNSLSEKCGMDLILHIKNQF